MTRYHSSIINKLITSLRTEVENEKIHQRRMLLLLMHFVYLCFSGTKKNEDDAEAEERCVRVSLLTLRTLQKLVYR